MKKVAKKAVKKVMPAKKASKKAPAAKKPAFAKKPVKGGVAKKLSPKKIY